MSVRKNDLIDRYLNAVKFWLPGKQQKDILAELAVDLQAQLEERESDLGRPLDEADVAELLKQRGSPMRVASGFIPDVRLINPAMFPLYLMVLKVVLLWVLLPTFALVFVGPLFQSGRTTAALLMFFGEAFKTIFFVIGIMTTVFAILDRYHGKWIDNWDPLTLPRVATPSAKMEWYNHFAGFAFGMAAAIFWGVVMWQRGAVVVGPGLRIGVAPIWGQMYWTILALTAARALVDLYCFVRRAWTRGQSYAWLALDIAGIVMAILLLRAGNWVDVVLPNAPQGAAKLVSVINQSIQIGLICAAIIPLYDVWKQVRRLYRGKTGQAAPVLTVS
jgi:hypothetical protein